MGYPAYKIHGWQSAPLKDQIAVVHAVGKRVGGKMDLMLDPFCAIRTFGDALKLGWACDEYGFFWYEDPFKDGGVSAHAHRKLRQRRGIRRVPTSLRQAIGEFKADPLFRELMPELMWRAYQAVKLAECDAFEANDEAFELKAHFDVF
jgi:L-alanine-DL-glutamate epimerase-like enolase superfamily enzyme